MDQDLEYINRFKSGDLGGFEMLVKKYQNKALNIAYSFTSNIASAEDIAQEAFIKIYRNLKDFRAESKFSSWLYRIVVNSAYDFLRRNKHENLSLEDPGFEEPVDKRQSEDILAKELVSYALDKVPFAYRSAIILREVEGLSYQEIGKVLKIGIGTVESRIFRARQMLKEILVKKGVIKDEL
jgi:RNA polymerase sigma-70 factor (ECF subfamily)